MHVLAYIVSLLRIGQIRTHQQRMSIHFMCINFLQTLNITCETFRQFQSRHTRLLKILAVPAGNPEGRTEGRKEGRKGENQIPFPSFPLTHRRPPALCRNYDAETRREGGRRCRPLPKLLVSFGGSVHSSLPLSLSPSVALSMVTAHIVAYQGRK